MTEKSSGAATSPDTMAGWFKSWNVGARRGFVLGSTLLGLILGSSVYLAISTAVQAHGGKTFWATLTGPIGDTFGGLLGPILNTAVLAVTVWVAVYWQPAQERQRASAASEVQKGQDQAEKTRVEERAAELRASQVVAWLAEAPGTDKGFIGVVVINSSDSLAQDVDFDVATSYGHNASTISRDASTGEVESVALNRESLIPPGVWFYPLQRSAEAGSEQTEYRPEDAKLQWALPVPLGPAGARGLNSLTGASAATNAAGNLDSLRPHLPERIVGQDGVSRDAVHFTIEELRYTFHGQSWRRGADGNLSRVLDDVWAPAKEKLFSESVSRRRTVAVAAQSPSKYSDDSAVIEVMRRTIEKISDSDDPGLYERAQDAPVSAKGDYLIGVKEVSRKRKSLYLHLEGPGEERRIRLMANGGQYPWGIFFEEDGIRGDNTEKPDLRAAMKTVLNRSTFVDAEEWLSEGSLTSEWRAVLQAIIDAALEYSPVQ